MLKRGCFFSAGEPVPNRGWRRCTRSRVNHPRCARVLPHKSDWSSEIVRFSVLPSSSRHNQRAGHFNRERFARNSVTTNAYSCLWKAAHFQSAGANPEERLKSFLTQGKGRSIVQIQYWPYVTSERGPQAGEMNPVSLLTRMSLQLDYPRNPDYLLRKTGYQRINVYAEGNT